MDTTFIEQTKALLTDIQTLSVVRCITSEIKLKCIVELTNEFYDDNIGILEDVY